MGKGMNWKERFTDIYGEEAGEKWLPKLEKRIQEAKESLKNKTADAENQYVILITYQDQFYGEKNRQELF